jgi:hypothetical protein
LGSEKKTCGPVDFLLLIPCSSEELLGNSIKDFFDSCDLPKMSEPRCLLAVCNDS